MSHPPLFGGSLRLWCPPPYLQILATPLLICGVPQGSVLGPVLFVFYTVELISLIERHGLSPHLYTDDTQVYGLCPPAAVDALSSQVTECADDIATWMKSNRLQLNSDKTEVLWCATAGASINFHPLEC